MKLHPQLKSQKKRDRLYIFDTTLRDGEQCPGASMNEKEKIAIAHQLLKLKINIIEAGFPVSSPIQFNAVKKISEEIEGPIITALARATKGDIESAYQALKSARKKRIHTFIATSPIHMKHKLGKKPAEILKIAVESVKRAKNLINDVEFSAEDATRSESNFLIEIIEATIQAGATTINLPDTVGYTTPEEYGQLFKMVKKKVTNINSAVLSAHCHNDLGLAVANSLAAIQNGARQVECTINGIGERAGNTAMEEIVMAIKTRSHNYPVEVDIDTGMIYKTSKMVAKFSGLMVQRNKAIVGGNAFAHESGIHQDGMLKNRLTYEIMTPKSIGLNKSQIILGRHSGRSGFKSRIKEFGFDLSIKQFERIYEQFLELADQKKEVFEEDIMALLHESSLPPEKKTYILSKFDISSSSHAESKANVTIYIMGDDSSKKEESLATATGSGPIAALFCALEKASGTQTTLDVFTILPTSRGKDSLGETKVGLKVGEQVFYGRGASTDIVEASAKAFIDALNRSAVATKILKK